MVYNTENGASLQKLPDSEITNSGNRQWILLLEIEKKESKTLNAFQKQLEQISQSRQYNQRRQGQNSRGNVCMRGQLARHIWKWAIPEKQTNGGGRGGGVEDMEIPGVN